MDNDWTPFQLLVAYSMYEYSSQKPKVLYVCMMPNMEWTLLCSAKLNICYADLKTGRATQSAM